MVLSQDNPHAISPENIRPLRTAYRAKRPRFNSAKDLGFKQWWLVGLDDVNEGATRCVLGCNTAPNGSREESLWEMI
jgi:hypothetical protein